MDTTGTELSGETRVAGVIGWPVRHSLSPTIHNAAFEARGLDWAYLAFPVPPERGGEAIAAMRTFGIEGLSVTMPHKEVVARTVDRLTPVAEALAAVNCVFRDGDDLVGDNTDGEGFVDALLVDPGIDPAGRRCAVVGAGGAGRAVAWALARAGAAEVVVVNRSPGPARRAAELAGDVGRVGVPADISDADLVVNATPLGMGGAARDESAPRPIAPELLHNGHVVADLIYQPATTPLIEAAREAGAVTVNGLGMLVHQAARAWRQWTGEDPPTQVMVDSALAELETRARFDA